MSASSNPWFAPWQEFFPHHPDVDRMNNNPGRFIQAPITGPIVTPTLHLEQMTLLHDICMLIFSPLKGHAWFVHHFSFIGNTILDDPTDMTYVVLCGIGDNAEVSHIDIGSTLSTINVDVPTIGELLLTNTTNKFRAMLMLEATAREEVYLTGVLCLPSFFFDDLAALHRLDIYSLF
jgi:hypothetical protein